MTRQLEMQQTAALIKKGCEPAKLQLQFQVLQKGRNMDMPLKEYATVQAACQAPP